jgi:hypothetical protein
MNGIEQENDLISRANAEIDALQAAGHKVKARRMAQGVEIEITRAGWQGPETSFLIVTPRGDA